MPTTDYTLNVLNRTSPENAIDRKGQPMTHMADALAVLNALPFEQREAILRMVQDLKANVRQRGFGEMTAFEVIVALARLMERKEGERG